MKSLIKLLTLSFLGLISVVSSKAQTILNPGDIAFVSVNSDGDKDRFAFVLLELVESGTSINFTDCGWNEGTGFYETAGDSHFTWTANGELHAGTLVIITTNNGNTLPEANIGSISGDKMLISIAGDQIFAYQGMKSNPSFISGISFNQNLSGQPADDFDGAAISNSTTGLPQSLIIGINAIHIYNRSDFSEQDDSMYNGLVLNGSKFDIQLAVNNLENWNTDNENPYAIDNLSFEFIVSVVTTIDEDESDNPNISIYPNPATDGFRLNGIADRTFVILLDSKGNIILSRLLNDSEYVDVSMLPKGVYLVRIVSERKNIYRKLIVN